MDGIFLGGSLLAAFLAGMVALFAPCCIVFMFPSYFAVAVRNRRWRLLPLTFTFAAGIALVLVPVTLGIQLLAEPLLRYHTLIYAAGAVLLLFLAGLAATGVSWALPLMRGAPDIQRTDSGGVFALGVFSGAASACCAPVLAGVLTLSALSPTLLEGAAIGLAYVFGMVFPLVILTALWDRAGLRDRRLMQGRAVRWSLGGRTFATNTMNLAAAALFAVMSIVLGVVALTGATVSTGPQARVAEWLETSLKPLVDALDPVPDLVIGIVLLGIAIGVAAYAGRKREAPAHPEERSCHGETDEKAPAIH